MEKGPGDFFRKPKRSQEPKTPSKTSRPGHYTSEGRKESFDEKGAEITHYVDPIVLGDRKTKKAWGQICEESDALIEKVLTTIAGIAETKNTGYTPQAFDLFQDAIKMGLVTRKKQTQKGIDFNRIERQIGVTQAERTKDPIYKPSLLQAWIAAEATLAIFYDPIPRTDPGSKDLIFDPKEQITSQVLPALTNLEKTLVPNSASGSGVQTE